VTRLSGLGVTLVAAVSVHSIPSQLPRSTSLRTSRRSRRHRRRKARRHRPRGLRHLHGARHCAGAGVSVVGESSDPKLRDHRRQARGRVMFGQSARESVRIEGVTLTGGAAYYGDILPGGGLYCRSAHCLQSSTAFFSRNPCRHRRGWQQREWSPVLHPVSSRQTASPACAQPAVHVAQSGITGICCQAAAGGGMVLEKNAVDDCKQCALAAVEPPLARNIPRSTSAPVKVTPSILTDSLADCEHDPAGELGVDDHAVRVARLTDHADSRRQRNVVLRVGAASHEDGVSGPCGGDAAWIVGWSQDVDRQLRRDRVDENCRDQGDRQATESGHFHGWTISSGVRLGDRSLRAVHLVTGPRTAAPLHYGPVAPRLQRVPRLFTSCRQCNVTSSGASRRCPSPLTSKPPPSSTASGRHSQLIEEHPDPTAVHRH